MSQIVKNHFGPFDSPVFDDLLEGRDSISLTELPKIKNARPVYERETDNNICLFSVAGEIYGKYYPEGLLMDCRYITVKAASLGEAKRVADWKLRTFYN